MKKVVIGGRSIGVDYPPFIIAEMSANHNQSLDVALKIVDEAARAGADAIKLQTYTADTMTLDIHDGDFLINDRSSLWYGASLYQLYTRAATPWEWHKAIFDRCHERGLLAFSTPFDETAVDFLESLHVPCYKIASFENNHLPLIAKVAATGKPLIISTGMASISEIFEAVSVARDAGCKDLILLKCSSAYPASNLSIHLKTIPHMQQLFDCVVGFSDHSLGIGAAIASIALGGCVIEKHFNISGNQQAADDAFSMHESDLVLLVQETKRAWESLGGVRYGVLSEAERSSIQFRRSLYVAEDMNAGDVITHQNIRIVRPGLGLAPKYINMILGRKVKQNIKKGTPLSFEVME